MAAFNWVEISSICPTCSARTSIRAQSHVAASFENDSQGRFCLQEYKVGDRMRWWRKGENKYEEWKASAQNVAADHQSVQECCYASCVAKGDRLFVILEFSDLIVKKVIEIGKEENWPAQYPR